MGGAVRYTGRRTGGLDQGGGLGTWEGDTSEGSASGTFSELREASQRRGEQRVKALSFGRKLYFRPPPPP